ncbi:MAG: DDE-type integrase/transposase/recombinase [Chloroflexi bacterium]|nr:DDE-type integrase/transposase/recombinase [Chloroflexota bacterium]
MEDRPPTSPASEQSLSAVIARPRVAAPSSREQLVLRAYEEHQRELMTFAYAVTRDRQVAEDLVQETFFRLVREIGHGFRPDNTRAWLYRVCANLATGRARTCHFVALVDDHSRFLLGIRAVPTKEAIWVLSLLEEAIELCGVPHELMSDNGTPFVAITRSMLSRFQRSLEELRIRHIRTQIDTPWTNGKIEAFWATLQAEVLDRQQLATSRQRRPRSPPTPATTTTTGSTASSTGRRPPSASTERRSPTGGSPAYRPWLASPIYSTHCLRRDRSLNSTGESHLGMWATLYA